MIFLVERSKCLCLFSSKNHHDSLNTRRTPIKHNTNAAKNGKSMADKQMNQFTSASDGAYIYAELSDGSQVKIAKADLIELIRLGMPTVSETKNGLMRAGIYVSEIKKYLNPGDTINIGDFNGFAFIRNPYSWGGQVVFWISFNLGVLIAGPEYGSSFSIEKSGDDFIINYNGATRIGATVLLLHIPMLSI